MPLSYTHDWGHFVGEFKDIEIDNPEIKDEFSPKKIKFQRANFVTFMDIGHTSEDDISKKIRLLKKILEKIFGENATYFRSEFIKLSPDSGCLNIDDSAGNNALKEYSQLQFFGFNAPLKHSSEGLELCEDSRERLSFLARALTRHQEITNSLS